MQFKGNDLQNLRLDLQAFMDHTNYVTENFEEATFLYAKGDDDEIKETMQYDPIRPCDTEEFLVGGEADHEPIRLSFKQIPATILDQIDPGFNPTVANLAFMFDEGTKEQRIYFLDEQATHTMHRLPIEKVESMTHARVQLLAENLFYLNKGLEMAYDEPEVEATAKKMRTCTPQMTVRVDDQGFKHVAGFLSSSANTIKIPEYINAFLETVGDDIVRYQFDDQNLTVIVASSTAEGACYGIHLSDTGYGEPTMSAGWITDSIIDLYIQSSSTALEAKTVAELKKEMKSISKKLNKTIVAQSKVLGKLKNIQLQMQDESDSAYQSSRIVASVPDWRKAVGSKIYFNVLTECRDIRGPITEYDLRVSVLQLACEKTSADYAQKLLSTKIAAQILGVVKPEAKTTAA